MIEDGTAPPAQGGDEDLIDASTAAEAVRELARRLQLFTREREELLAAERAARSEAERAIRQKDEFMAILSHELRTPLANVLNWAHVLQERFSDIDELLKKGLSVIADNTTAQARLISDLLDMSRITSGKVALEPKPVDFPELIAAAVTAQRPSADARRVALHTQFDGPFEVGLADPVRLQQVLWNLISNAIKFTPSGGQVVVRAACCEGLLRDSRQRFRRRHLARVPASSLRSIHTGERVERETLRAWAGTLTGQAARGDAWRSGRGAKRGAWQGRHLQCATAAQTHRELCAGGNHGLVEDRPRSDAR